MRSEHLAEPGPSDVGPFSVPLRLSGRGCGVCLRVENGVRPAVLGADRYGAVWARLMLKQADGDLELAEVLEHPHFIQMQCPECGALDLPVP